MHEFEDKKALLEKIMPQYIILKPSILGGFKACQEWIAIAKELKIGWWITSALESNILTLTQTYLDRDELLAQLLSRSSVLR